jgi:hypothetical protein
MAGSGAKKIIVNTLERAVSTDINRLQSFLAADIAEALRYIYDVRTSEASSGGTENVGTSTTDPLRGVVLSGLRARPEIGTTNLYIEPGECLLVDPDAVPDADDSPLKWIKDPGVTSGGVLTLPAPSAADRVDVIECQRTTTVTETASRDIFNTTTGQFTSALVNKAERDLLTYRIRQGTSGGGWAGVGTASGWLPLAVYVISPGATDWNDITLMWDVRPLLADVVSGSVLVDEPYPARRGTRQYAQYDRALAGTFRMNGFIDSTFGGRRIGGEIGATSVVGATGKFPIEDYQEPGFTPVLGELTYFYCAVPFGLPRWAQYTAVSFGKREPGPFRGIVIHSTEPCKFDGIPQSPVSLPTVVKLGGSSLDMRCIAVTQTDSTPEPLPFTMQDGWVRFVGSNLLAASSGDTANQTVFDPADDTQLPRICNIYRGHVIKAFSGIASVAWADNTMSVKNVEDTVFQFSHQDQQVVQNGNNNYHLEIPVRTQYPYGTSPDSRGKFFHDGGFTGSTVTGTNFAITELKLTI